MEPFRGSVAVRAGWVTWAILNGPSYRRVGPDTYLPAGAPGDPVTRIRAAAEWAGPSAVVTGWSACVLRGADVLPWREPPTEIAVADRHLRPGPAVVRRQRFQPEDLDVRHGLRVTSGPRTAFDLATRVPLLDAVVAADGLGRVDGFTEADLAALVERRPGARGVRRAREVAARMDSRAESPQETRTRLLIVDAGLPAPVLQYEVRDGFRFVARVDLAWPGAKVAVEYDGHDHALDDRRGRDLDRCDELRRLGWEVIVVTARQLRRPGRLAARVREALRSRGVLLAA